LHPYNQASLIILMLLKCSVVLEGTFSHSKRRVRARGLQAPIGFEREIVFKARPHPDLLHLEKEQREDVPGFANG
jgi:hypothetical protein